MDDRDPMTPPPSGEDSNSHIPPGRDFEGNGTDREPIATDGLEISPFDQGNDPPGRQSDLGLTQHAVPANYQGQLPLRWLKQWISSFAPPKMEDDSMSMSGSGDLSHYHQRHSRSHLPSEDSKYFEPLRCFVVEPSKKFRFGTVFEILWAGSFPRSLLSEHDNDSVYTGSSISEFEIRNVMGNLLYEGIRRFIVVDGTENGARNGNSICVPIATYKRQGCKKHRIKPENHGIIHTPDQTPMMLNGEPQLGVPPVRLLVNKKLQGVEHLAPESRVNYAKHVTIEHNAVVHIIGQIHHDDLETLESGVDSCWNARVRARKKDNKHRRDKG